METVNAMASAAAKAVWGDSNAASEPVSGKTGNTSAGEPYDAGNLDQTGSTTGTPAAKTPRSGSGSTDPSGSASGDAAFAKNTGTAATADDTPENPSTQQKLKDSDASKGQQDTRDPENPLTNPKSAPTEVNEHGNQEDGANEDIKLDGPGPKPLEEVAREHGGDAGAAKERKGSLVPPRDPNDTSEGPKTDANKNEDKGDGTQYVKSSGLKADGGDFDATAPGAGREADRLMEEKGMHPNADTKDKSSGPTSTSHDDGETKEKKKLTQRIKEKLHSH
ncbi:uncharacterized protein B0I36DRAFT_344891 [Microdochium trichocladiopsis]|uniref:Glycine-rich cell wall structural protein 1 n=1 Tax=Microdochium trichocladiopsis TaxID=1682393 RepID=A0A9P8YLN5_9PEZI|nr:uncharacterized protein B0I36DRAFT_344891 [Microdochium trichocladiopsis]KAH7041275.1 hypothetical protein B0I36DRAFT_344891 [Microdochium trichocladiopsis]